MNIDARVRLFVLYKVFWLVQPFLKLKRVHSSSEWVNIVKRDVWICSGITKKNLHICLLIASFSQEGKIAGAYWFLLFGFGAMLSGTQLIWYILLVLLHKCFCVCISSFHLLNKKRGSRDAHMHYSLGCIHQRREPCNYSPSSVRKVNLPVPARRWMTVVSSAGLLARRCVFTDVSVSPPSPQYVPLCVSRQENKMLSGGKGKGRVQSLMRGLMMTSMKDLI